MKRIVFTNIEGNQELVGLGFLGDRGPIVSSDSNEESGYNEYYFLIKLIAFYKFTIDEFNIRISKELDIIHKDEYFKSQETPEQAVENQYGNDINKIKSDLMSLTNNLNEVLHNCKVYGNNPNYIGFYYSEEDIYKKIDEEYLKLTQLR